VLHVIPSVAACRGGPSAAVLAMTRALNEVGVEADVVASNDDGPAVLNVTLREFVKYEGARVCFLPRWSPGVGALREFQYSGEFADWFREHAGGYDGVHVHAVFSFFSTRAMQLARGMGLPYIVRPLGQLDPWSLKQKWLKKRLYFAALEGRNVMGAELIHCTSVTEAENVKAVLPGARVEVLPHGVKLPEGVALRGERGAVPTILFLSRWHPKKNIEVLLAALATMREEAWQLYLAGSAEDGYAGVVRASIRSYGLEGRVVCPGHVTGDEKARLLSEADVFVLPSASENFGIAAAEALACGLKCVVSTGVDLAPLVRELDGGSVCEPTAPAVADALRRELGRVVDRETLAARARTRLSWEKNAESLKALYGEVFQ
jgi:glycosyltransferase involved in cell wall biosynthesis